MPEQHARHVDARLGWRRGGHLCRVNNVLIKVTLSRQRHCRGTVNTVWSHWQVASRSSEVNFTKNYTLLYLYLYAWTALSRSIHAEIADDGRWLDDTVVNANGRVRWKLPKVRRRVEQKKLGWLPLFERRKHSRLTVFYKAFNNLLTISLDHLSVSSRHILEPPMKINLCHCLFVLMLLNIHSFLGPLPIGIPSHWLFASRSRFSLSMKVCWARHPPIIADHNDTLAVTGGLHPLLDIAPKNRRTEAQSCRHLIAIAFWHSNHWRQCVR